ncbi:MAG: hypothetical protein AB1351_00765 [Thermoproteota archaeon]
MGKALRANNGKMVKTCSAKCPVCQRLIADSDKESLLARVKRHTRLRHQSEISEAEIEVEDLSTVAKVFGSDQIDLEKESSPQLAR